MPRASTHSWPVKRNVLIAPRLEAGATWENVKMSQGHQDPKRVLVAQYTWMGLRQSQSPGFMMRKWSVVAPWENKGLS